MAANGKTRVIALDVVLRGLNYDGNRLGSYQRYAILKLYTGSCCRNQMMVTLRIAPGFHVVGHW
jgi:hypothetical protein